MARPMNDLAVLTDGTAVDCTAAATGMAVAAISGIAVDTRAGIAVADGAGTAVGGSRTGAYIAVIVAL